MLIISCTRKWSSLVSSKNAIKRRIHSTKPYTEDRLHVVKPCLFSARKKKVICFRMHTLQAIGQHVNVEITIMYGCKHIFYAYSYIAHKKIQHISDSDFPLATNMPMWREEELELQSTPCFITIFSIYLSIHFSLANIFVHGAFFLGNDAIAIFHSTSA